ncbi:MAG: DUF892 family protein [Mucilaginibacter sp.]
MTDHVSPKGLNHDILKQVFIHNLNRLYFGKCYIAKGIGELTTLASFRSLQLALEEFEGDIITQIQRMDDIYQMLGETPSDENCNPLKSIVKDKFCLDEKQSMSIFTDTDIILYIQLLEHVNIMACRHLKTLAASLNFTDAGQLLTECFDESVDNDNLFMLINEEYYHS